jgi:farnesyl-diphosphate farnesyltransferase
MTAQTLLQPAAGQRGAKAPGPLSDGDLDRLLERTSRTFALAIPQLPPPTRRQVTLAYLLFRIADTFEDSECWDRARRLAALAELSHLLDEPRPRETRRAVAEWLNDPPSEHPGYRELVEETPRVLAAYFDLDPEARRQIGEHTARTAAGMSSFVLRASAEGRLELRNLSDLRAYCYAVAGIVGEMLTELYLLGRPGLRRIASFLRERAALFGEGLQLVNILKDSAGDATAGRSYLPAGCDRAEVFALARRDLEEAARYTLALQEAAAPRGVVAFNALPILLARATLERVERHGPGAKITRSAVFALVARMNAALDDGRPVVEV